MSYLESKLITLEQELATTKQEKYSLESDLFLVKRQLITAKQELATIKLESEREMGILESKMFALETKLASIKKVKENLESMLLSVEANDKLTKATITIIVKATMEVTARNDQGKKVKNLEKGYNKVNNKLTKVLSSNCGRTMSPSTYELSLHCL